MTTSCLVTTAGAGCSGAFSAPAIAPLWQANFEYYAQIDKNKDSDFSDSGEKSGLVSLQVVNTLVACIDTGNCPYFFAPNYYYTSTTNWLGILGSASKGGGRLVSECSHGSNSCKLNGFVSGASNGETCSLVDACGSGSTVFDGVKTGKWDETEGCIICDGKKQFVKIADASSQCFNLNCSGGSSSWSQFSCASSASGNLKCESACGADADCDERAVNTEIFTGTDGKKYKCDETCKKVLVEPPLSKITGPNPGPVWYSDDINVSVIDQDRSGTDLKTCYFQFRDPVSGTLAEAGRPCNTGFIVKVGPNGNFGDICMTQGKDKCEVKVWACDNSLLCTNCNLTQQCLNHKWVLQEDGTGNWVKYNVDYTAPEIKH